ncbi:hypothetical protein KBTX_00763 [wastewater metagenome]|uniref:DUF1841 domain-containing protein n=2 Tax=unclassified sequences TaxID=12908 RepID=A0A5B8RCE9_9ZZZZ|nr:MULTISPECIES: DUF1841 family protein [Arhodomonas]MCS4503577.1 DUF1841 family protein [Arhodomonas aquaeolei]QEA04455.1 hypothetical protein KBTEX_00763 [uncultured organism]
MLGQDRNQMRRFYLESWRKAQDGEPMDPMERLVAEVVAEHPEYHGVLADGERALGREYLPEDGETNPFLHMGLHIALREQVANDRPPGIRRIHETLTRAHGERMAAEHRMMDCLAEALWQAQRQGGMPDEAAYLTCLEGLAAGRGPQV